MISKITGNPNTKFILIGLLVIFIIYMLYRKYQAIVKQQTLEPIFIRKPLNAKKASVHSNQLVPLPKDGTGYTLSVWLYINDWDYKYGEWKHILHKGDKEGNFVQPGIWLHPTQNKLFVKFDRENKRKEYRFHENKVYPSVVSNNLSNKLENTTLDQSKAWCDSNDTCQGFTFTGKNMGDDSYVKIAKFPDINDHNNLIPIDKKIIESNNHQDLKIGTMEKKYKYASMNPSLNKNMIFDKTMSNNIDNVPLGRWFHLGIVVSEQATEIYVDGTLRSTETIESNIKQNNGQLWITQDGGFSGIITQLKYYNTSLNHGNISDIYSYGPKPWMYPDLVGLFNKYKNAIDIDFNVKMDVNDHSVGTGTNIDDDSIKTKPPFTEENEL